jgi:hypothetical protein
MDINGEDSKMCFRNFENGKYPKHEEIPTRHPNILKGVIIGKKSWGLHVKMWSDGISEGCFTMKEILEQFYEVNIEIPEPFLKDFRNTIYKKIEMK